MKGAACETYKCSCGDTKTMIGAELRAYPAGSVCMECSNIDGLGDKIYELATMEFPIQNYRYGLCPMQALQQGTMFPELIK